MWHIWGGISCYTGEPQKAIIVLSTVCIYRFCIHGPSVAEGIIVFTRYFLNCSNKNLPKSRFILANIRFIVKSYSRSWIFLLQRMIEVDDGRLSSPAFNHICYWNKGNFLLIKPQRVKDKRGYCLYSKIKRLNKYDSTKIYVFQSFLNLGICQCRPTLNSITPCSNHWAFHAVMLLDSHIKSVFIVTNDKLFLRWLPRNLAIGCEDDEVALDFAMNLTTFQIQ